jgi:CDP-glucose 4,6-dehydratase
MEGVGVNVSFWQGKKVLITGHTGFKGSWLSLWLQRLGACVLGYAGDPPTTPSLFATARVAEGMFSIQGDIRDLEHLKAIMTQHQPEIVIHMAAQPLVRYAYEHPVETYTTNIMGTVNVLEAVRRSESVRVVVNVTSDKCYENREWVWGYRENEPMGGHDPYSSSKGCAELVTAAYREAYFRVGVDRHDGVAVASARAGNVLGGGDWAPDRLVPDVIQALMAKRPVIIRHPHAVRPWQHVLEPLRGYLALAEKLWEHRQAFAEGWNFGPDDDDVWSVAWVVDRLITLWQEGARWESATVPYPHENDHLKLDCSKAKAYLGWSPRLRLSTALERVVEWYRSYQRHEDMRQVTEAQIARFEREMHACKP